jgi:hypothetical protein
LRIKKVIALLLCIALACGIRACGEKKEEDKGNTNQESNVTEESAPEIEEGIEENKTMEELQQSIDSKVKVSIKVDYPNFAGKVLLDNNYTNVFCVGNKVVVETSNEQIPLIASLLTKKGISIYGINTMYRSLEDIYLDIVNKGKAQKIL